MAKKLITISDLHISTPPLDDFDPEIESKFNGFVSHLASAPEDVELVINGDFLDFVQAPPFEGMALEATAAAEGCPLCFTEDQSLEKLQAIYQAHPSVFTSLQAFLSAKPGNEITVLPGNHDADFFWSRVQESLLQQMGRSVPGRLRFHLERVYRPSSFPGVWIEHGHQFDKINSFFLVGDPEHTEAGEIECWSANNPPIFRDQKKRQRLLECLGTRFLIRFLNRLDRDYPYVDNVKPFSVFVRLFAASALLSGYASLQVAVTVWRLLSYLVQTGITRRTDLLSLEGEPLDASTVLAKRLQELNERSKELQQRVQKEGFKCDLPLSLVLDDPRQARELMEFLSDHVELLTDLDPDDTGYLGLSGEAGTLSLARGFHIDESQELIAAAKRILTDTSVRIVIMGHTHEPQNRPGNLAYFNTGSWTRYYQHSREDKLRPWSLLKSGSQNVFPFALKYAEVDAAAAEQAQLKDYT